LEKKVVLDLVVVILVLVRSAVSVLVAVWVWLELVVIVRVIVTGLQEGKLPDNAESVPHVITSGTPPQPSAHSTTQ